MFDSLEKKQHPIKRFFSRFNLKLLFQSIERHGFKYSFSSFLLQTLATLMVVFGVAYICRLEWEYIVGLLILTFILMPLIVAAQFDQLYQIKRFQMVVSYLENVVPVFKNRPLVTHAWEQILDLLEGEMKETVQEALNYVLKNTEDEDPYLTAFKIIERHFPNSRIHAVHQMMYTIMTGNSKDYYTAIDNMYYDITHWINRSYEFQNEIKHRRKLLVVICILTLLLNCWFVFVYVSSNVFEQFTTLLPYQISSVIFIAALLILTSAFYLGIHAKWLVDDQSNSILKRYVHDFEKLRETKNTKTSVFQLILCILLLALSIYFYIELKNTFAAILTVLAVIMLYFQNKRMTAKRKKSIKRALEIEFPMFLRDVSLNLHHLTVLNAIENSRKMASSILDTYLQEFLNEAMDDPSSIVPYTHFLEDYDLPDVRSAMKVLYTFQTLNKEQLQLQSNNLIIRNQEMLAKSENLRNKDELVGIEMLAFLPAGLFILQTLVNMAILLYYMLFMVSGTF